ncbi:MAG: ATP synthase F1 subunit epsilon [Firmicutes bacterium]|nr:ATP synthase F1 subunit epsilon [Bacillota bacterium]
MGDLLLEVLSHHGQILKADNVEMVNMPTVNGPATILRNHTSFISLLNIGVLRYKKDGIEKKVALGTHGIVEVYKNHVSIYVHTAENEEDIDIMRAKRAKELAEGLLSQGIHEIEAGFKAELALKKALIRLSLGKTHED